MGNQPEQPVSEQVKTFTFDGPYQLTFSDWGSAGLVLSLVRPEAPYWDRQTAMRLDSDRFEEFLAWASRTAGRAAQVLPNETLDVLSDLSLTGRVRPRHRKVLSQAIQVLTYRHQEASRAQRALNR
jgi:hypothetical protein